MAFEGPLAGRTVALPETRMLDVLAGLLERRGAAIWRCPMVAILDHPDEAAVVEWMQAFIDVPPALTILLTGEGLRRLLDRAERRGIARPFREALARQPFLVRGPKPARVLKELGLEPRWSAVAPTTAGVIETLRQIDLAGQDVGVQLYGEEPNLPLMAALREAGANPRPVAPYVYAPKTDDEQVVALIGALNDGRIDAIVFTSQPQFRRLREVAQASGLLDALERGMARTRVAAVGPVVAGDLGRLGIRVDVMPSDSFFMKPLVSELVRHFTGADTPADC
ncbi:MAG TPA: uroporphyrinogen-III synthase [Candidatus Acidoferrales bacterium]|nr:uroporphyrinogen-III synthase [Candidatus Acidoferrales bacterium]